MTACVFKTPLIAQLVDQSTVGKKIKIIKIRHSSSKVIMSLLLSTMEVHL